MKKAFATKLFASAAMALSLGLTACLTDSDDDALKITSQPQSVTAAIGDSISFSVTASGGEGTIKYMWIVTYPDGVDTLPDTTATIKTLLESDVTGVSLRVVVSDSKTSVTSNSVTITATFAATGDTLTLGAQGATAGSALDLDSGSVLTQNQVSASAYAALERVDLVVLYYNNAVYLNGTKAARDSGVAKVLFTNAYPANLAADIKFVSVSAKPATVAAAESLYTAGAKLSAKAIAVGDKFVVMSTEDVYHYLEVQAVTNAANGTADLTLFLGALPYDDSEE